MVVECKNNMKIENIHMKPYDNISDLMKLVEECCVKKGDSIIEWNKP